MPLRINGAELRRRRELLGMTLTEFAQRAGYSLNHCCQIELGNSNGSPKYQRAAAHLLECGISDITDGEPIHPPSVADKAPV